jgi:hypothetical protein
VTAPLAAKSVGNLPGSILSGDAMVQCGECANQSRRRLSLRSL